MRSEGLGSPHGQLEHPFFDRQTHSGAVAELADALDLGSSLARGAGSIPVSPISRQTKDLEQHALSPFFVSTTFLGTIWGHAVRTTEDTPELPFRDMAANCMALFPKKFYRGIRCTHLAPTSWPYIASVTSTAQRSKTRTRQEST